jgi:aminopeptidase N/puromycin-sensitive aminopeptidase
VGDYLAFAEGLQSDRSRAVLQDLFGGLDYINKHLVSDGDQEQYRAWLVQFLTPMMKDVGWEPKPGESDEQKTLRARLVGILGYQARDPEVLARARTLADQALANPSSVDHEMLPFVLADAAVNGAADYYDHLMTALKNAKSPEEYYNYFFALAQFSDPKLLQRTLDFSISTDVRSQDALQLVTNVLHNPAGQSLAWEFIRQHWPELEKVGGPFASAEVVGATNTFCDPGMRDQVTDFFNAHKVAAAERTYKQSIERINDCVQLKNQQQPQLASWLGQHGNAGGK